MRITRTMMLHTLAMVPAFLILLSCQIYAGDNSGRKGYLLGLQSGYGHVTLRSDQREDVARGTFGLGFQGGYAITSQLVLGLEIGGWLLQPYNLHDESRGESVSNFMLYLHAFPFKRLPLYVRTALGHSGYSTNSAEKQGGGAWGAWLIGSGYEIPASDHFKLAAQIGYGRGRFSDVPEIVGRETGRRYEVAEISVALHWCSGVPHSNSSEK